MSYGIFKSKEEYDAWMKDHAEAQNMLEDLKFKLSIKEAELAAGEAIDLANALTKDEMLGQAHSILTHAVSLLGFIIERVGR